MDPTKAKKPERRRGLNMFITKTKRQKVERAATASQPEVLETKKVPIDPGVGNSDIYFKFNAGFSNAVRQNIVIKDL